MNPNYFRPQLLVRQILARVPTTTEQQLNACVLGPKYSLHRYGNTKERATLEGVLFEDSPSVQVIPYEDFRPALETVDPEFTKLFMEKLEVELWHSKTPTEDPLTPYQWKLRSLETGNELVFKIQPTQVLVTVALVGSVSPNPQVPQITAVTLITSPGGFTPNAVIDLPIVSPTGVSGSGAAVQFTTDSAGKAVGVVLISQGEGYAVGTFTALFESTFSAQNIGDATPGAQPPLIPALYNRPVQKGDLVYTTADRPGAISMRRLVVDLKASEMEPSYGSNSEQDNQHLAGHENNPVASTAVISNVMAPPGWVLSLGASTLVQAGVLSPGTTSYTSPPALTVSEPIANLGGVPWPTVQAQAKAVLDPVSGRVVGAEVTTPGAGYYEGGAVGVVMITQGSGYGPLPFPKMTVTLKPGAIVPPDYRLPILEPVIDTFGHVVDAVVLDPGYHIPAEAFLDYRVTVPASGTVATFKLLTTDGMIRNVTVKTPGAGYAPSLTPPVLVLDGPGAGSGGITATAKVSYYYANQYLATVAPGSSGYKLGSIIRVGAGGTGPQIKVTGLKPGTTEVSAVEVLPDEFAFVLPADAVSMFGAKTDTAPNQPYAGGTRAVVTLNWGIGRTIMTNPGHRYTTAPLVTGGAGGSVSATFAVTTTTPSRNLLTNPTITAEAGSTALFTPKVVVRAQDWSGLVSGASYQGKYGERYTLTIKASTDPTVPAMVDIVTASGTANATNVKVQLAGRGYVVISPALQGLSVELLPLNQPPTIQPGQQFSFVVTGSFKPITTGSGSTLSPVITVANRGLGLVTSATPYTMVVTPASGDVVEGMVTAGVLASVTLKVASGQTYKYPPIITLPAAATAGATALPVIIPRLQSVAETGDLVLTQGAHYTGPKNTRYIIRIVEGSEVSPDPVVGMAKPARVTITDTTGVDTIQTLDILPGITYPLGIYGLSFQIPLKVGADSGLNNGYRALAGPVTANGAVQTPIPVAYGGTGYPDGPVPVHIYDDDPAGASAVAVGTALNGSVVSIAVTSGGSGYTAAGAYAVVDPPPTYQKGLRTNNAYYVDAVAAGSSTTPNILVLNGQAADLSGWTNVTAEETLFDVDFRQLLPNGEILKTMDRWEAGDGTSTEEGGVQLNPGLAFPVMGRYEIVNGEKIPVPALARSSINGRLFASYRSLVTPSMPNKLKLYYSEKEITDAFGLADMDNPVCYGALMAFRGAQFRPVWVAAVASNDLAGYQTLLDQAERIDGVYAMAPMSYDLAIQNAFRDHVTKCSKENWKLWRRAYVATASPGPYAVIDVDPETDGPYMATVSNTAIGPDPSYTRVICINGTFLTSKARQGDFFRTNYQQDGSYDAYEIEAVMAEDELILVQGPESAISTPQRFEIWRPDDGQSQAEFVAARSAHFANRRVMNVWVDNPQIPNEAGRLVSVPVYYVAAEIAGLRSAVLPQQGLTYTEIRQSATAAPMMFTKYTQEELNIAAASGTYIITQEVDEGPLFIRHQLTTDSDPTAGTLYYEDSVGTNLDAISYQVRNLFQPYIGRRNANVETLEELETKFRDLLGELLKDPGGFSKIGPALITWSNMELGIDKVMKDRINIRVNLQLPLPINVIDVTLYATTLQDDISIVVEGPELEN